MDHSHSRKFHCGSCIGHLWKTSICCPSLSTITYDKYIKYIKQKMLSLLSVSNIFKPHEVHRVHSTHHVKGNKNFDVILKRVVHCKFSHIT